MNLGQAFKYIFTHCGHHSGQRFKSYMCGCWSYSCIEVALLDVNVSRHTVPPDDQTVGMQNNDLNSSTN